MRLPLLMIVLALAACDAQNAPPLPADNVGAAGTALHLSPEQMTNGFFSVLKHVEPVAERECRRRTRDVNCQFQIVVDQRPGEEANAFQSVDDSGRPILTITLALIAEARNPDEIAFVIGHEAAHHILGHLKRQHENALAGAEVFAGLAELTGGNAADVADAQELGAAVGARSYTREFELEADELGTVIAYRAGYDPLTGAQFFAHIPEPENRFLSTHPSNVARYEMVVRTVERLGG